MVAVESYDVAVIGGGPAGLFCAAKTAGSGCRVVLLEKNTSPGAKLLLSGSGQCNITHAGEIREFLPHYPGQEKFIRPALFGFSNRDLIAFFRERGLEMMTEERGKVFPQSRSAADVLAILMDECRRRGVEIRCGNAVTEITTTPEGFLITTPLITVRSGVLVIATGGASYPKTGSTGDGYRFAGSLCQPVTEIAPGLTPLLIRDFPFAALMGISFEDMRFSVWREHRKLSDYHGDVLFTHLGLSGPGILDASRDIRPDDEVRLSFAGKMTREEFVQDLVTRAAENPTWQLRTILAAYPVPERLNRKLLMLSGIPDDIKCAHFSAAMRSKLATLCTEFPLTVSAPGGFSVAMVTRGGVAREGVNKKTMESTTVPHLYFAGEVLDIDGDTGGYNLQAAFSTGYLAAQGIREKRNYTGKFTQ
ncbi:MAG: NAD(P)/FAD-dependent oxidoreductase [Methanoregula sp.]|jgi:hypothetical protein